MWNSNVHETKLGLKISVYWFHKEKWNKDNRVSEEINPPRKKPAKRILPQKIQTKQKTQSDTFQQLLWYYKDLKLFGGKKLQKLMFLYTWLQE